MVTGSSRSTLSGQSQRRRSNGRGQRACRDDPGPNDVRFTGKVCVSGSEWRSLERKRLEGGRNGWRFVRARDVLSRVPLNPADCARVADLPSRSRPWLCAPARPSTNSWTPTTRRCFASLAARVIPTPLHLLAGENVTRTRGSARPDRPNRRQHSNAGSVRKQREESHCKVLVRIYVLGG